MNLNFTGFVLAGGKSSRMGADKAFLEFGGETFLKRAANTLSGFGEVKIVLNKSQTHFIEKLPAEIEFIFDVFENRGALGGIHAALLHCETEFAIILAVDLPFVDAKAIRKLTEISLSVDNFLAIVPRQTDGRLQPLCAVYHVRDCLPLIEKLLNQNQSISVGKFLDKVPTKFVEQIELTTDEKVFFNVNRSSDFQMLK